MDGSMHRATGLLILITVVLAGGCQTSRPAADRLATPPREIVARINANSQRIPSLWARINLYAEMRDPETGKRQSIYATGGNLLYRAPGDLRMRATKDLAGLLLDVGINSDRYWVIAPPPGPDKMWWGYVHSQSQPAEMLLRPQDLLAALAIRPIDLAGSEASDLRYRREGDVDVLTWYSRSGGQDRAVREVFYDSETLLPKTVVLFGADGRAALEAKLSNYASVDSPSKPEPRVARLCQLRFPQDGSWAELRLLDMQISRKGVPNEGSFTFPERPPVSKVKQVGVEPAK
jgi:hypothetical protein